MPVNTEHPEYKAAASRWRLVRDAVEGEAAIKAAGDRYLPRPNPDDRSAANRKRYDQYKLRANFLEVTGRTRNGLVGSVFRRDPLCEVPDAMAWIVEDADGYGSSIVQLGKWVVGELLEVGRTALFVDYPEAPAGLSVADAQAQGFRPLILPYRAESLINWAYSVRGGSQILSLAVLREQVRTGDDEFDPQYKVRYRVLRLTEAGATAQLYDEKGEAEAPPALMRRGDGQAWSTIPLAIIGAADNDGATVDDAPLYGLATTNIAHYRNSADYEEGIFMHGQGTLFVSVGQMSAEEFQRANPNGVAIGARAGHVLGQGGSATLVQMTANSAAKEGMDAKEAQMIAIGARLITPGGQNKTAEEARMIASAEGSVLSNLTGNASEGIESALEMAALYIGLDPEPVRFALNQEFFEQGYDPQVAIAKMQELDRGLIARQDYRRWLRRTGEIASDRTDEEIDDEAAAQLPPGLGFGE